MKDPLFDRNNEDDVTPCDYPGCNRPGEYRAPRDTSLTSYYWFCLEHVRQYNAAWNYYEDMSEEEMERQLRYDTVWHRPSWPFRGAADWREKMENIRDPFDFFGENEASPRHPALHLMPPARRALEIMELSYPVTREEVREKYRALVKKTHPDMTGGDKAAEERFKAIGEAYRLLMDVLPA